MLNELIIAGINDAVIDNPMEIAEMVAALGDTEWYDAEQVADDFLSDACDAGSAKNGAATVTVYCSEDEEGLGRAKIVSEVVDIFNSAEFGPSNEKVSNPAITLTETWRDDSEWKDAWKEYYHTTQVSERFVVKPTWETLPDDINTNELFVIEIDPGMAFGTGTHETTSLSLRMMEKYVEPGDKVLDVGTGSGILAIAAAKLGAAEVLGIDIDEDAVRVANENLENNQVDNVARAIVGDLTEGIDYKGDVVVANLLADLVMKLTSSVAKHMADDAVYITSGILVDKQPQVAACLLENGFTIIDILEDGEWCSLAAKRKNE